MTDENKILDHTSKHYPKEAKLIERSMVNFYHSRLQKDKSEQQEMHQLNIFEGVMDLFEILSVKFETDLSIPKNEVFEHLRNIHIKT